ncbi:MAG: MFS transporter [Rhodospirillales bacterium]|nr:MFS transporter [Rhodospirillales bacterium]
MAAQKLKRRLALPLLRPLAIPAVALLWGGLATSAIGDQLFAVVLSWVAVGLLGTAAGYLSALAAATTLATALLAGHWADRVEHRRMMIGADLARAAILLLLAGAWLLRGSPALWSLIMCVLVLAAGLALFRPAMQAVLPGLVDDMALLPAANALLDTTERIARLLGPGLVGLAGAVLPLVHFVTLDAATFIVSAAAVFAILRLRPREAPRPARAGHPLTAVLHGFRAVRRHALLGFVLSISGVLNGAWYAAYFLGLPLMIAHAGITGPGGTGLAAYGLVISGYGSTNLLTTLIVGNRAMSRRPGRVIFTGNLFLGSGIVMLGLAGLAAPAPLLLAAFMGAAALSAIGGPLQDITVAALRQTALPRADLPAAVRAFMALNQAGTLVALAASPLVFDRLGVARGVTLCGATILVVGACGLWRHAGTEAAAGQAPR